MSYSLPLSKLTAGTRVGSMTALAAALLASYAILTIFSPDVAAAFSIWNTSSAYSYCYLILPISLYLIYSRRAELRQIEPAPSLLGTAIFIGCLGVWWLGMAASITELRQFAIVGMLQAVVFTLWGWRLYRRILFPMLYLFLMVPTATLLLGPLQTVTTTLSSDLLRLTGIPVIGENHFIEVPHGLYEVAPGCAGLNFLLSTLALSSIYVVLVFRGGAKRFASVVAALLLSIATNAVRVFGIIWLAEATNRRIDIVDDHVLYGWGVYFVVMVGAMILGLRFRDPPAPSPSYGGEDFEFRSHIPKMLFGMLTLVLIAGGVRASYAAIAPNIVGDARIQIDLPLHMDAWVQTDAESTLPLSLPVHSDRLIRLSYGKANAHVEGLIAYDWRQREGYKIIDIAEVFGEGGKWLIESRERQIVMLGEAPIAVVALRIVQGDRHRLLWSYDWIGGRRTTRALSARLLGMGSAIDLDGRSAMIIFSAPDDDGHAGEILADFAAAAPPLERMLAGALLSIH